MSGIKNIPVSVAERLKNKARESGRAFDSLVLLYFQERFLYRLSISKYSAQFVLKGGLFLFSQTKFSARPTKDVDFLAKQIANDLEKLKQAFEVICSIDLPNDGVIYLVESMTTERIKEDASYEGVRIKVTALLGRIRKVLQFDIGFGDVIVPKPQSIEFPVLLDMDVPRIQAYSKESVISEKFEAAIRLSVSNSRMKDFYDIYTLLSTNEFDGRILFEAVRETVQHRGTPLEKDHPLFSKEFSSEEGRIKRWDTFINRMGTSEILEFEKVMRDIRAFLEPIYNHLLLEEEFFGKWDYNEKIWIVPNFQSRYNVIKS